MIDDLLMMIYFFVINILCKYIYKNKYLVLHST